jgi:hypothetical protein
VWTSAHLFYQGDFDLLIVKVVGPLVEQIRMADPTTEFFFLRYWEGGPHVRLRISSESSTTYRPLIELRALEFFDAFPSNDRLTNPRLFVEYSSALAERERVHIMPVRYPNDSIQFIDYTFDSQRYGATREAVEKHFYESSRLALGLLNKALSIDQRQAVAFTAVLLSFAACHSKENEIGELILSSWGSWGFENPQDPERQQALLKAYQERKGELTAMAHGILHSARSGSASSADVFAAGWFSSLRNLFGSLKGADRKRRLIVDACAHMLMNRLGLSPSREGYVRYLAAHAAMDVWQGNSEAKTGNENAG